MKPFKASMTGPSMVTKGVVLCVFVGLVLVIAFQQPRVSRDWRASADCADHGDLVTEDGRYHQWLSTFMAPDPAYQDYCSKVLNGEKTPGLGAQYSQDVFLCHSLFKTWAVQGRKGFYVESGANDPEAISSSLFFDKCLCWQGLCVEPQPQYHEVRCTLLSDMNSYRAAFWACAGKSTHLEAVHRHRRRCMTAFVAFSRG
jgi:hypothetical protein